MLRKMVLTAAAAAAVSVPLAGVAWADQPDGTGNNNPVGVGGVPEKVGAVGDALGLNPNGTGNPLPPGTFIKTYLTPGALPENVGPVPENYGKLLGNYGFAYGRTPPGMGPKAVTPGCDNGTTGGGAGLCLP